MRIGSSSFTGQVGLIETGVGLLVSLIVLVAYQSILVDNVVSKQTVALLQLVAFATLVLFLIGIVLTIHGLHVYLSRKAQMDGSRSWLDALALSLKDNRRIAVLAAITYGLVYAIVSGTLVYQSDISFSQVYQVAVPSVDIATCCGPLGSNPQGVVYLTEQVGLVLTPLDLALLFALAWLVGANISTTLEVHKQSRRLLSGFAASTGLFTACPTCASLYAGTAFGGISSIATVIVSAQSLLVTASVAMLLGNLITMSRRLSRSLSCSITASRL